MSKGENSHGSSVAMMPGALFAWIKPIFLKTAATKTINNITKHQNTQKLIKQEKETLKLLSRT